MNGPLTCSSGYKTPTPFYGGAFPAATCACESSVSTHGSCTSGSFDISGGTGACNAFDAGSPAANGGCTAVPVTNGFTPAAGEEIGVVAAPYTPELAPRRRRRTAEHFAARRDMLGGEIWDGLHEQRGVRTSALRRYHRVYRSCGQHGVPDRDRVRQPKERRPGLERLARLHPLHVDGADWELQRSCAVLLCRSSVRRRWGRDNPSRRVHPVSRRRGRAPAYKAQRYTADGGKRDVHCVAGSATVVALTGPLTLCCP